MRSYASIDRIEGEYAVLELELLDTEASKITSFRDKETVMIDFYKDAIIISVGEISEGDILIVEHEGENIYYIYQKDIEEKQRRIQLLNKIMNKE